MSCLGSIAADKSEFPSLCNCCKIHFKNVYSNDQFNFESCRKLHMTWEETPFEGLDTVFYSCELGKASVIGNVLQINCCPQAPNQNLYAVYQN